MYGNAILKAATGLEKCVRLSLTGVEYLVLGDAVKTIIRLRNVVNKLSVEQVALTIFQDNNRCLEWAAD